MATRMATLLYGSSSSVDATLPMPIQTPAARSSVPAGPDQVAWGSDDVRGPAAMRPSAPQPRPSVPPPALPAIVAGLVWTAAVWFGLAMFVVALAYPFSILARFALLTAASWLVAAGAAYALAGHRETHRPIG